MQAALGQPVLLVPATGASGPIAANTVRNAVPDGHTLFIGTTNLLSFPSSVLPGTPYNAVTDLAPISLVYRSPLAVSVSASLPVKSFPDLVSYAKANPGKLNFGSSGSATTSHFFLEELKRQAGLSITHVPYRTVNSVMTDLAGGQVDITTQLVPQTAALVASGRVRMLAVTSTQRAKLAPDVPTLTEAGYPTLSLYTWGAIMAPRGTPPDVVTRLNEALRGVLQSPEMRAIADPTGLEIRWTTPKELGEYIQSESQRWGKLVKEANITVQ
jgi:tripartite-type tricarboxylate transporter receptor subunit TctC